MIEFSRILKECFWDVDMQASEIKEIISGQDFRKKQFLFEKILLNSTKMLRDLSMFESSELQGLLDNIKIPSFNYDYVFRRKNIVEVYFFNSKLLIDELKWVA